MYLKDKQYYIDLYDKHTVEMCREIEKEFRNTGNEIAEIWGEYLREVKLYTTKGERYLDKDRTIEEWEQKDREKDDLFNSATAPKNICCLTCGSELYEISKDLHDFSSNNKIRILFMYECPNKCLPRRAFFDDGSEWQAKPRLCPECRLKLAISHKKEPNKIITTETCSSCGYKDVDVLELTSKRKSKVDKNFAKDRERFCISEKEGLDYLGQKTNMELFYEKYKDEEDNKEKYKKLEKLEKLTFVQLKNKLSTILEEKKFICLDFGKPEIEKDIKIDFTTQDSKDGRKPMESEADLKSILKKMLKETNWRLVNNDVGYKLGILSGRLRGYENKEDLLKLV